MGQKPQINTPTRSSARQGTGFESGARHRAHTAEETDNPMAGMPGPLPPGTAAASSPVHSAPDAEESVPRRSPKLMFGVIGGLIAIVALAIAMIFFGPPTPDDSAPSPESVIEANG